MTQAAVRAENITKERVPSRALPQREPDESRRLNTPRNACKFSNCLVVFCADGRIFCIFVVYFILQNNGYEFNEVLKMKFKSPMLVVADIDKTVEFYKKVLGLHVIMDFGANKTLTGGLCLQTLETWKEFIGTNEISFGSNNAEIYFEEDDFDKLAEKLKKFDIEYIHPIKEHSWGQRVVRFYDPDKHIIEVGENMKIVCKRFLDSGMTPEQVAERMDVPMKFVSACMR